MDNVKAAAPESSGLPEVIAALEQQLATLDRLGAHLAAAHLDSAIQQLRHDQARANLR